ERREPASRPFSLVRTARRVPHLRPPSIPGKHAVALRPSSVPLRVPLPASPESSLPEDPDPGSNCARAASPTVSHLLATAVTDPSFESASTSALVAELLDFAAACRLDYATEEFECLAAVVPRFASMLLALEGDSDAPDIPTPRSYAKAITSPYSSQWVKQPPDSPPVFKARYVARGFSQRQGVDYFHNFSPTSKMTTLRVFLHVAAQRDYDLRRPVYGLRQAPREWHDTLRSTLAALGFSPSTADPSLFLCTDTSLPPFYVLEKRHTCTDLGELRSYLGLKITRDRAQRTITLTHSHMVHQVLQRFNF
ncbi:unnamed protein product, partial [Closterium sp. NIES-53]